MSDSGGGAVSFRRRGAVDAMISDGNATKQLLNYAADLIALFFRAIQANLILSAAAVIAALVDEWRRGGGGVVEKSVTV